MREPFTLMSPPAMTLTSLFATVKIPRACESLPEKVLFATDAYPYIPEMGWEESGWMASRAARMRSSSTSGSSGETSSMVATTMFPVIGLALPPTPAGTDSKEP